MNVDIHKPLYVHSFLFVLFLLQAFLISRHYAEKKQKKVILAKTTKTISKAHLVENISSKAAVKTFEQCLLK